MSGETAVNIRVLFVCLGNICRSPTAEGVFRARLEAAGLQDRVSVDSAGTAAYHLGNAPDARAQAEAATRGYDLSGLRARQVIRADFDESDYVLAMDPQNLRDLQALWQANGCSGAEPGLFLGYAPGIAREDVPDPYYGGQSGFSQVLDLCEQGADGLVSDIRQRLNLPDGSPRI